MPSGPVDVQSLDELGILILRGSPQDVREMEEIIRRIQEISALVEPEVRVFQLHRASAFQVRDTIIELYGGQPTGPPAAGQAPGGQPTSAQAPPLRRFQIAVNDRANTLIVLASPQMMQELEPLIRRLDVDKAPIVNEVRVFQLRNAEATEMANLLNEALLGAAAPAAAPGQAPEAEAAAAGEATLARRFSVLRFVPSRPEDKEPPMAVESGILDEILVTAQIRTNSVIVSAPASSMDLMTAIIRELDQPPTLQAVTRVIPLRHADATNLRITLSEIFDIEFVTTTGVAGIAGAAAPAQFQRPVAVAPGDSPPISVRVAVDPRTNSLVVTGAENIVLQVEAVIRRLDSNELRARINSVIRLSSARATDVAAALTNFYQQKRQIEVQQAQLAVGAQQTLVGAYERIEREVIVVPLQDIATGLPVNNMLLVSASPRRINEVIALIKELDAIQPQVLVQVMIAELEVSDDFEFGIEWGLQDDRLFGRSEIDLGDDPSGLDNVFVDGQGFRFNGRSDGSVGLLGNSASDLARRFSDDVAAQGLANFVLGRASSIPELGGASGLLLTASSETVSAMLRALQAQGQLEVISRPQIMTLDGTLASIFVGEEFPFVGSIVSTQTAATTPIEFRQLGVSLLVTPTISPDGRILMRVEPSISQFIETVVVSQTATDQGIIAQEAPRFDITTASTVVNVMDGQTVVLGGLIQRRMFEDIRKIPWLGDLPHLGFLFRFIQQRELKSELMIILTPHVVRGPEDAERLKNIEIQRADWILCNGPSIHGDLELPELSPIIEEITSEAPELRPSEDGY